MLFRLKMKPENNSGKWQWTDGTLSQRSGNQNTTMCSAQSIKKKKSFTDCTLLSNQFGLKYMSVGGGGVHRVTDSETFPVRIFKEEAPTPLPLFISPLSFHLSRALLGVWHFVFCCCVYSSFQNGLNLIREPAFYWVFYFPNLSVFVSSYVKMKKVLFVLFSRLAISWPPWVKVWGWDSDQFFTIFFSLLSRVVAFIYDVWVRGVISMFNETAQSFFAWDSLWVQTCLPLSFWCTSYDF